MKILADASLPGLQQAFPHPFELTLYKHAEEVPRLLKNQQILLCRSTLKVDAALLMHHSLTHVATASSGTDHIDSNYLKEHEIELIDAKGCNATAVVDYVMATLAYLQKNHGFYRTRAAVIGVGEVGKKVARRLAAINMQVIAYDPLRAQHDSNFFSSTLVDVLQCDLISIHANLHEEPPFPSKKLVNEAFLNRLNPHTVLINAARGGIVDEEALLQHKKPLIYCTDVFQHEPSINNQVVDFSTLCTPHIAGHSIEAKYKAIAIVSEKLHQRLHRLPPKLDFPVVSKPLFITPDWQDAVLSLYDPGIETSLLKASKNRTETFLQLRQAHQNRHDFCSEQS